MSNIDRNFIKKMEIPWKDAREFYNAQIGLLSHPLEVPLYHSHVVGNNEKEFMDYIFKQSGIDKNSRVVDMGCGTGYVVDKINEICYAEGISNSEECVKQARMNFPNRVFKVESMEDYVGKDMTHFLFLESLFHSNVENTLKNSSIVLAEGAILFVKEQFDVCDNFKKTQNKKYYENFFKYYPQTVSSVIEIAEKYGFECLSVNRLSEVNFSFVEKSIKYHTSEFLNYEEPYMDGYPYVEPFELKFKKSK
jgi:hypothetical protein